MTARTALTYRDYAALPDDGKRYEIHDGEPDIIFLESGRHGLISSRAIEGPPTLAVEILSPSTARIDRVRKRELYARYGVPYYWLIDVDAREIEACALLAGAYVVAARVRGTDPVDLPPFVDLALVPASLWP